MLTDLIELSHKIEENVKAMQSEIKENVQGANRTGRKPGLKSKIWTRKKKHSTRTE